MSKRHLVQTAACALSLTSNASHAFNDPAYLVENDRIIPSDSSFLGFGYAVSIHGEIVGATAPYMFYNIKMQTSQEFGNDVAYSIDLDDSIAIVGGFGIALVYDISTFDLIATLTPPPRWNNLEYGEQAILTEHFILISDHVATGGQVYVYDRDTLELVWRLRYPNTGGISREFGHSLAVSGSTVLIGAPGEDANKGAVYLFDLDTGLFRNRIVAPVRNNSDRFGQDIDVHGCTAAIGAYSYQGPSDGPDLDGAVFLLDLTTQEITDTILNPDPRTNSQFGYSVALNDEHLVVGHKFNDDLGDNAGIVHLYELDTLTRVARLRATDHGPADGFGNDIAISGNRVVVGANLGGGNYVSLFTIPDSFNCPIDLNLDGELNFFDVSAFLVAFLSNDPQADCNQDGVFNAFDVFQFIGSYTDGCP